MTRTKALEQVLQMGEGPVLPGVPLPEVPTEDPQKLEARVEDGYLHQTVGQLLERARLERGMGKRELARKLGTYHARVSQLEQAENLELKSLLAALNELGYDLELSVIDRESGRTMGAVLGRPVSG